MDLSDTRLPENFTGIVRLFPLPNLVLFPGVVQALHIFEPRYRKMMDDSLAADKLVTICLYKSAEDAAVLDGNPVIHDTVCIAKVVAHKVLQDGRYNLLIVGVKRAKINRELGIEKPYRMAEVTVLEDVLPVKQEDIDTLRGRLIEYCQSTQVFKRISKELDLTKILETESGLGLLVDLIGFSTELDCSQRQSILELVDVKARLERLLNFLSQHDEGGSSGHGKFPPEFSDN